MDLDWILLGLACMICITLMRRKNAWLLIVLYWLVLVFKIAIDLLG